MTGRIDFEYLCDSDILVATPHWHITTAIDIIEWNGQYVAEYRQHGRKMDVIYVLTDFVVAPEVGTLWGDARGRLVRDWVRFHYRVSSSKGVLSLVSSSSVRFNVSSDEAPSVRDAILRINADRRRLSPEEQKADADRQAMREARAAVLHRESSRKIRYRAGRG